MDARALFDVFWTVEQKHPSTAMITLIGFVWKKKVIYTSDASRVSKSQANFHFEWTNPFNCNWI